MNCTRVLHSFGSHPQPAGIPVDLAMCLSLNQLLSMSPLKPTKSHCQLADGPTRVPLRSPHFSMFPRCPLPSPLPSSPLPQALRSCFRRDGAGLNKKRVIFADAKGLPLTAVHVFIPDPSSPDSTLVTKPSLAKQRDAQSNAQRRHKLRLGFPQPALDFNAFFARLREKCVQLQSCAISENTLIGKVYVSHVSSDKAVHVRATFNSWQSHHDIPCTFLQQLPYRGPDLDVFAFGFILPKNLDPKERVEFCVYFRPGHGATPHWDDNRGQNYKLCIEEDGSSADQGNAHRCYPTVSLHRPPSLPPRKSQNSAELQCLQRSPSRADKISAQRTKTSEFSS